MLYIQVIKVVGNEFGYKVLRIDEPQDSGRINDQILDAIAGSEIVLCDLTGERQNCYFETGFAYATGRNLIFTIREGERIHFDLAANRFIVWKTKEELANKLRERLAGIGATKERQATKKMKYVKRK